MATNEPHQAMPAKMNAAEDNAMTSGGQAERFLPKPFAVRDCPPGMRIRGGRPILAGTGPKSTAKKETESEEKQHAGPSRQSDMPHKRKKAGVVLTKVKDEEVNEERDPLN